MPESLTTVPDIVARHPPDRVAARVHTDGRLTDAAVTVRPVVDAPSRSLGPSGEKIWSPSTRHSWFRWLVLPPLTTKIGKDADETGRAASSARILSWPAR